ncbi:hypothetical protein F9K33_03945 [bacterium]|nr:MAG: hypothetical protein F9K33_03945 [bacterium]
MKAKHFFLTGLPFVGKTTALLRSLQLLDQAEGFVTQAVELDGKRIGLNIINSHQRIFKFASLDLNSAHRSGKYSVDIAALNTAIGEVFDNRGKAKYIYIDEIGTLFCQSPFFIDRVSSLLESHTLIGVIAKKGHSFVKEIHRRPDCCFTEVTADNRDDIPNTIMKKITGNEYFEEN